MPSASYYSSSRRHRRSAPRNPGRLHLSANAARPRRLHRHRPLRGCFDRRAPVGRTRETLKAGLPRALIPIYGITFLDILGFTILIPLLPFLAKRFGAADVVAGSLNTTVSSPFWGALSDRFGRKAALLGSQIASLAGYLLLAFADGIPILYVSRTIEGFGGGNSASPIRTSRTSRRRTSGRGPKP